MVSKKTKVKKVTLIWMNMIRDRLKDRYSTLSISKYKDFDMINQFLKPIIEYGESEEQRITKHFKNKKVK